MNPYYDMYYDYRSSAQDQVNEEVITFEQALELIKKSVGDEKEDEMFYEKLINDAPNQKEKDIIISIRDDERKHNKILRDLYFRFTGIILPPDTSEPNVNLNMTYKEALEKALFGELEAVKKYRKMMGAMPNDESYTLLMSIMTDELRHANKYNFLIAIQR